MGFFFYFLLLLDFLNWFSIKRRLTYKVFKPVSIIKSSTNYKAVCNSCKSSAKHVSILGYDHIIGLNCSHMFTCSNTHHNDTDQPSERTNLYIDFIMRF